MAVVFTQPIAAHGGLNWDTNLEAALTELKTKANFADQGIPGADLNQVTTSGHYFGSSLANAPLGSASGFMVIATIRPDGTTGAQLAINVNGNGLLYMRRYTASTWQAWYPVVTSANDTGWVTASTGITAATGWTLNSSRYRNINGVVSLYLNVTRTGAALTANAAGIITPTAVAVLPAALVPAQSNGLISAVGNASTVAAAGYAGSNANVTIVNVAPSQSVAVSGVLEMVGSYLL